MRINVPNAGGTASVEIIKADKAYGLVIQNVSAVQVWISDDQNTLDGSVDSTGTPQQGLILAANSLPLVITAFKGVLYTRSSSAGGVLEVIRYEIC